MGDPGKPHTEEEAPWVLVADDDAATRLLLRKRLEKSGYRVLCAKTGKETVNRLSDKVASAVLDLKMPGGDGLFCLRYIRRHFPDMAPLILTASENIANAVEAMKQGALDYVTKPFNPGQVAALVDKSVEAWRQARRLRAAENKLEKARQHQLFVASQIHRTLLLGRPPADLPDMDIAHMTIASQQIDGDFYDFIQLTPDSLDLVVADIMGKGIMAAFMAAALKSAFLRVINNEVCSLTADQSPPEPEQIVAGVYDRMVGQMKELETFVTCCYGRFDLLRHRFVFVDCGHVRTLHWKNRDNRVDLLSGVNVPLGFPETAPFQQMTVSFAPGDLFLFYSDGVTEAADPEGRLYEEKRLAALIEKNAGLGAEQIVDAVYRDVVAFTGTKVFTDDFTCVCAKIPAANGTGRSRGTQALTIESRLENLKKVRSFVRSFCRQHGAGRLDELRLSQAEVAATELVSNIIKHGLDLVPGHNIQIAAAAYTDRIEVEFRDHGKGFDPGKIAPPVLDGSRENGMGCYLISRFVDDVSYFRDKTTGANCARIRILLFSKA
jgi:sigma-B regulation protein RsbU (phosphoserine phosphatase)